MNLPTDSKQRKGVPIVTGVLDYFPLAIAAVARVSKRGNDKHNAGQPLHWAREKSADHIDCVGRHLLDRDVIDTDSGETELSHAAWRILAALEVQQEKMKDFRTMPLAAIPTLDESDRYGPKAGLSPICYISGGMRGYKDYNFPAFDAARDLLTAKGFEVISPADLDRRYDTPGKNYPSEHYVRRDTKELIRIKEKNVPGSCIVLLEGWEHSKGAKAEKYVAEWLDLPVKFIGDFR